jgi:hypothetical protein
MSYSEYAGLVVNGRKNVNTAQGSVMPAFGTNRNVMCYLEDIFIYLRAGLAVQVTFSPLNFWLAFCKNLLNFNRQLANRAAQ